MVAIRLLKKSAPLVSPLTSRFISTSTHLHQELQYAEPPPQSQPQQTPLPPNPASGSPLYRDNWRNATTFDSLPVGAITMPVSLGFLGLDSASQLQSLSQRVDANGLMDQFAQWMTLKRWENVQQLFQFWIKSLDNSGKPNMPDVNLYNQYLQATLMTGASAGKLLDLVMQMEDFGIVPNTASFNIVLKGMMQTGESLAAEKLIERMLETGQEYKDALPDGESYDSVIGVLLYKNQIDRALKYIDLTLRSGYMLSMDAFLGCVRSCVNSGRLDTLVSIIERCKKMDQNKSLLIPCQACNYIADIAMQSDNSDLTYYALEFMAKWIARGEMEKPAVHLSVDEGLVLSALGTAGRTQNLRLLDGSWAILKRSLRQKKIPNPESYLGKIFAHANSGNLQKAFSTLHEFETAYGNSTIEDGEGLFSPFYSLNPLVLACSKKGFRTLDLISSL